LGQRLGPLTRSRPKPMLPLGDKPILEVLLEQFRESGFTRFFFAVNYLAEQIMSHFGDGSAWDVRVEYLREDKPLGTVGALSLIERRLGEPVLVANGDIVTKVNFKALLNFHKEEKALATLCIKPQEIQVPYGVVELDGRRLRTFVEKPTTRSYINAGIYVLEPEVLSWMPKGERRDMPRLISDIQARRKDGIACFPIQEYWMDIGELQAYRRAGDDYSRNFE
ncbi:MAG: NTP transferase domain-containing protein, partial [Elusimicrobia bacterium]|nr:NTP transferase domain-containing protein [Elusimicrobiota bacterium]